MVTELGSLSGVCYVACSLAWCPAPPSPPPASEGLDSAACGQLQHSDPSLFILYPAGGL